MEDWQVIRERCVGDQEPKKRVARDTGIALNTVRKYAASSVPPQRYGAPTRTPVMAQYESDIDALLKREPKITSIRIAQLLREKHASFRLGERAVRKYIARRRVLLHPKDMFIRQVYVPGDQTQYDFKDVKAIIAGEEVDLHLFMARLSYSTAWFGRCYRTEDRPALFDGLTRTAVEFGGVTREGLFDNPKTAVDKVQRGRHRNVNAEFSAFSTSLAINMQFAAPGKGNEKGGVEGSHGYVEDNFFRPIRSDASLEALNAELLRFSREDRELRIAAGQSVAARFEVERAALRLLPAVLPRACVSEHTRVTKFAEVRCRTNRYSVPSRCVGRPATVELFADRIRIVIDGEAVAEHPRLFERHSAVLDPMHYIDALRYKHRAVERAEVFNNARFPEALRELLRELVRRDRDTAGKQFVRVVELLKDHRMPDVVSAVQHAAKLGVCDPAAIALLLEQRTPVVSVPLSADTLPEAAKITAPQVHLDGYVVAELKEVAA